MRFRSFTNMLLACGLLAISSNAMAFGPKPNDVPANPDLTVNGPSQDLLKGIFDQSTQNLEQANILMAQHKFGEAMLKAKEIVDQVSVINPKGNFDMHIPIDGMLADTDLQKSFIELRGSQKEGLAQAVTAFKGGYFLDLLNLYKRSKLTYVKAFYQQMHSQLLQVDIDMMRQSLIDVYAISILVKDVKASDTFLLFDSDIANPDEQYMFNREVIATAIDIKELNLAENDFLMLAQTDKSQRLKTHLAGVIDSIPVPKVVNVCHCDETTHGGSSGSIITVLMETENMTSWPSAWSLMSQNGLVYGNFNSYSSLDSCISAEKLMVKNGTCSDGAELNN